MVKFVLVMALVAILAMPVLGTTWDLASDFSNTNPMGAWTIADGAEGWGPYHIINGYGATYNTYTTGQPGASMPAWDFNNNYVWGMFFKNNGAAGANNYGGIYDAGEVGVFQGCDNVWGWAKHANWIVWTAPTDMAEINISAKFSQIFNGNLTSNVAVKYYDPVLQTGSDLFSDTITGYRGNPTTSFSDAIGTHNTTTFNGTLQNIVAGQVIAFKIWEPTHTDQNQTGLALTITSVDTPEPGSMLALGSGLVGLVGFAIRRKRA